MKRVVLPVIFLLGLSLLFALESEPSDVVGFVKYDIEPGGWNMAAIPMSTTLEKAAEFLTAAGDSITSVAYFNATTQAWVQYVEGGSEASNFDVGSGDALLVNSAKTVPTQWYNAGALGNDPVYNFESQWNMMYLPLNKSSLTKASELLANIGENATSLAYYNATTQAWVQYVLGGSEASNFDIEIGRAYLVNLSAPVTGWNAAPGRSLDNGNGLNTVRQSTSKVKNK